MTTTTPGSGVAKEQRSARILPLTPRDQHRPRLTIDPLIVAAALIAATIACSPLTSGYYSFTAWAPLTLGAIVVLVLLVLVVRPKLTGVGAVASVSLALLAALSFASILWAESRDSAWTSANQLALYLAIFAIGLLAVRKQRSAHIVLLILGMPALLTSIVLAALLATGGGGDAYLLGRLDQPIGYVNATAGLLAMGIWPWLALAEFARTPRSRATAIGAAAAIASIAVTTQARALVPAFLVTTALVMAAAPGRTRRAVYLVIVVASIAISAHWTLAVYSSTGPTQAYMPPPSVLRGAGIAVIGSSMIAAGVMFALMRMSSHLPADQRLRISRWLGRIMLAAVGCAVLAIAFGARGAVATQWRDFTHLNPEQSAPDRFVAIGSGFRFDLWRVALDEFEADPIVGIGAGNYDDSYYRLRRNPQSVTVPHSLEMQMLAELGALGLIALLMFCGSVLRAGVSSDRRTLVGRNPGLRIAALGVFTAWLAETSFDWLYNIPGLTGMAMLAAAILVAPDSAVDPGEAGGGARAARLAGRLPRLATSESRSPRRQLTVVAALGLLALLAASVGRQYAATLYGNAGQALATKHPLQALEKLRTAEQLDPWSMQTQYAVASAYARLDDYAAARTVLVHAERMEPENYVPPALLGDIATRAGDYGTALAAYRRALSLDPHEPVLRQAVLSIEGRAT